MDHKARTIVLQFIDHLNNENFSAAQDCLHDDFVFEGVLGRREGAAVYIREMMQMKLKYQVQQSFEAGTDISLWYMIDMGGKRIPASGWYHTDAGKIRSLKVVFDPRPLLDSGKE